MYAIIRAGGKQAKVRQGDVIEVERVKGEAEEITFSPLLLVDDDGTAHSDRSALAEATVTAKVLGETQGEKLDIFKYKSKTGYRRHMGHRQKYTQIEITGIELGKARPKAKSAAKPDAEVGAAKPEAEAEKDVFDPKNHTVAEVLAYVEKNPAEAKRVAAAERSGKARVGILEKI